MSNTLKQYCQKWNIKKSKSNSFYFYHKGVNYRISNHPNWSNKYMDDYVNKKWKWKFIYIQDNKRVRQIHKNILDGIELDQKGYPKKKGGINNGC